MSSEKCFTTGWAEYELIDAGGGKKLERWGKVITIRPELQAYFKSGKPFEEWYRMAHWEFVAKSSQSGKWKRLKESAPEEWTISYKKLDFHLKLTKFKHVGLFPEQKINWDYISEKLGEQERFLNLFAYTGAASIVAKQRGANTFHVDSVKQLISWAKDNMELSKLENIKWVHEDALKFAQREFKRGNKYKGIIMDPPAYGIGAKKERWKLEEKIDELMENASKILEQNGFLILNTYSPKVDVKVLEGKAKYHFKQRAIEVNGLWMKTTTGKELYYGNLLRVT
ncbi:class I SAM-dependent methyltransferase [Crocinitomicaceae bacterium]|nr:class I SAM-dependent methyltransferase [Crocinitomicaceae bacterium]